MEISLIEYREMEHAQFHMNCIKEIQNIQIVLL